MILTVKLLVILNYPFSDILKKGEYPQGYYNPGDVFDEIHILITVQDEVDMENKIDIADIKRQLRKIDDCFCYIIVELNRNDDIENKFYKRFGELLKTLSNETLLKIRDIKRAIYMHKF